MAGVRRGSQWRGSRGDGKETESRSGDSGSCHARNEWSGRGRETFLGDAARAFTALYSLRHKWSRPARENGRYFWINLQGCRARRKPDRCHTGSCRRQTILSHRFGRRRLVRRFGQCDRRSVLYLLLRQPKIVAGLAIRIRTIRRTLRYGMVGWNGLRCHKLLLA
jgi:hypothetical protein